MILYISLLLCLFRMSTVHGQSDEKILKSSISFVIDDTISLKDGIEQVKLGAKSIFDTVQNLEASLIENFILVTFSNSSSNLQINSENRNDFVTKLNSIKAHGGGNCQENVLSGIKLALEQSLPGSFIFVFTDAVPKDLNQYADVESLALKGQSQVVFILTGPCDDFEDENPAQKYQVYYDLAKATLGQVFHVQTDEISQILQYVEYIINGDRNVIHSVTYPPGYKNSFNLTLDSEYKDVAISVTGEYPKISILGPEGSTPKIKYMIKITSRIAILQLLETKPGVYVVELGSKSETNAVVSAYTSINFIHGFSLFTPSSINDTTIKPVPDTNPYLLIKLLVDDMKLETAKIIDIDGNIIKEMPLEIINEEEKNYLTKAVELPKTIFRISVTGNNTEYNEIITRTGPPVKPQNHVTTTNKIPTISIDGGPKINAQFNKPLLLKCRVNGFPKPDIIWTEKNTGEVLSTTVSVVELESDYINVLQIDKVVKNATYQCSAKNTLKESIMNISVETELKYYFDVLESPKDKKIDYEKQDTFTCKVDAYPPPEIKWYLNGENIDNNENIDISKDKSVLTIKKMHPNLAGQVICVAKNSKQNEKKLKARLRISGVALPRINKDITNIHIIKGSNATINCNISQGYPKPHVQWYFKPVHDNGTIIQPVHLENTENSIDLTNVNSGHAGTYKCAISNIMGSDTHILNVYVNYAPIIEENEKSIVAKVNQEITMKCIVDGDPTPNVTWYKDGEKINNTEKYHIDEDHSIQLNVTSQDTGSYVCIANNTIGNATSTIEVDVLAKPKIDKSVTTIYARKGYDQNITCRLIEGNPNVTISWYFKPQQKHKYESEIISDESTISMQDVNTTRSGTYRCSAFNNLGNDTHKISLAVEYPPVIKKSLGRISVKEDKSQRLLCDVDGIPIPEVTWLKDGSIINDNKTFKRYSDHSLRHTFSSDDGGNYTCLATNKIGTAVKSIIVDVYSPVNLTMPTESAINSSVGDSGIKLLCQAEGYPSPEIKWTFFSSDSNAVQSTPINIPSTASELQLPTIIAEHRGFYVCTASNNYSSAQITYTLLVNAPPKITNTDSERTFKAVNGDLALRITCNVTGYPKPSISWLKDDLKLATGSYWYESDDNGTLIIKNVDSKSAGSYLCIAANIIDSTEAKFIVSVIPYPEETSPPSNIMIENGSSATIKCDLPHEKVDLLRWYKGETLVSTGEFNITNVTTNTAGLYTCRVSNFSSASSSSILVKVGFKPKFRDDKPKEIKIDLVAEAQAILNCEADGEPKPKVSWWHDDKEINSTGHMTHDFKMQYSDRGIYNCNISNEFGNTSRSFIIESKDCFLKIESDFPVNQPLISSFKSLKYDTIDGYLRVPNQDFLTLSCPNKFTKLKNSKILAFCLNETNVKVNGKIHKYSELQCTEEIKPIVQQTGMNCFPGSGNTEKIKVAYNVSRVISEVYEVCFDKDKNVTIYANYTIHRSIADVAWNTTEWMTSDLLPYDFESLYDCELQINNISQELSRWFHRDDGCCFSKRQLVNPRDMLPGLAPKATFNYLNIVPQWSKCKSNNWDDLENKVRALAKSSDHKLLIWTGTFDQLSLPTVKSSLKQIYISDKNNNRQPIPKYLWKVVQDPMTNASLAIIQVNVPDLLLSDIEQHILCDDICKSVPWMKYGMWHDVTRGYTYCCTIQDFVKEFKLSGVFNLEYSNILKNGSVNK